MIGWRVSSVIKRFAGHRDDMRLANFQRVCGLNAEWKLLRCPTEADSAAARFAHCCFSAVKYGKTASNPTS
jgi:hypothetical protein